MNKFNRPSFLLLLISVSMSMFAHAETYCVTSSGLDSNTGLAENGDCTAAGASPWKTLNSVEVFSNSPGFQPGDKILFNRDERFISSTSIVLKNSGDASSQSYIEFGAYGTGSKPILQLSGHKVAETAVVKWLDQENGVWLYPYIGSTVDGLWKDGVYLKHAEDEALENGDFHWVNGTGIYYKSADPTNDDLYRGGSGYGFHISALSFLKFNNLHFASGPTGIGGIASTDSAIHNIIVENCKFENLITGLFLGSKFGQGNHDITLNNNIFKDNGRGVIFTSLNNVEKNSNMIITNNIFDGNDPDNVYEDFRESIGFPLDIETISFQNGNSSTITDNTIFTGAREGAIVFWTNPASVAHDNLVARNVIHDITGPGISMFGSNTENTHTGNSVQNNVIYNCSDDAIRLSADDSPNSNSIYNNTISNCSVSFHLRGLSRGFSIFNNISLNPTSKHVHHDGGFMQAAFATNIYYPDIATGFHIGSTEMNLVAWKLRVETDTSSISVGPLFIDALTNDFHLNASSPAVDVATPVGLMTDFDELPILGLPDIGAYEFGHTDTDNDGLNDYTEIYTYFTDPNLSDSDGDTLSDGDEINLHLTNPLEIDTDSDGFNDGVEVAAGSDPKDDTSIPGVATGDINGDGEIDTVDVLIATKIILGSVTPTANQLLRGDVAPIINSIATPNGVFNAGDLVVILQKAILL